MLSTTRRVYSVYFREKTKPCKGKKKVKGTKEPLGMRKDYQDSSSASEKSAT
jgi:hypothetical protein